MLTLVASSVARADSDVAVVVSGPEGIATHTRDVVETWFASNKLTINKSPLPKDALKTLLNCFVLADMSCARGVVEARAKASNIIGITEQVSGKKDKRSVQLGAYWIAKEHEVVSVQRTCDACTDEVLEKMLISMLGDLAELAPTMAGTIHVTSTPSGLKATIDGETDAKLKTPFDQKLSFGTHMISVMRDGRVVAQKKVDITPGADLDVPIEVREEPKPKQTIKIVERRSSRAVPVVLLTVGVAACVTGGVLYKYGGPTGDAYTYRNMRPAALATGISGGVAVVVGTVWLLRGGSKTSHPEVSITPTETTVGWARTF